MEENYLNSSKAALITMVEESILIEKSAKETAFLAKKIISQIYGKVIDEETRRIYWEYEIGIHTIQCESLIETEPDHTIITTTAFSKTRKSSSKQVIDKFHKALRKNSRNSKTTRVQSAPVKKRTSPQKSKPNFTFKSITSKHVIIGSIILIITFSFFIDSENADGEYISQEGYYGAYTKEDLDRLMRYGANNDEGAINQMYTNGRVIVIPPNRKAHLVEQDFATVKIRLEGNTTEFWTVIEAIKD